MNNTDPTSFKSILERVKRLREQESGGGDDVPQKISADEQHAQNKLPKATKVINAFNQQRSINTNVENEGRDKRLNQSTGTGRSVLVNTTQKENPLLNHLKNTNWRYIKSSPTNKVYYDYLIKGRCVLFLTLSYHKLYADYITRRMQPLVRNDTNILIFVVDDNNSDESLNEITKQCMFNGFTLLVAFNFEQAAKYIEYLGH